MPGETYRMGSIIGAREVYHAINAGEGGAVATIAVRVKLLLGEDIPARLFVTGYWSVEEICLRMKLNNDAKGWSWLDRREGARYVYVRGGMGTGRVERLEGRGQGSGSGSGQDDQRVGMHVLHALLGRLQWVVPGAGKRVCVLGVLASGVMSGLAGRGGEEGEMEG